MLDSRVPLLNPLAGASVSMVLVFEDKPSAVQATCLFGGDLGHRCVHSTEQLMQRLSPRPKTKSREIWVLHPKP